MSATSQNLTSFRNFLATDLAVNFK